MPLFQKRAQRRAKQGTLTAKSNPNTHMLSDMRRAVLFGSWERPSEAVGHSHYVQNAAHKFRAVAIAGNAISEQSRVNVDAIQESDCRNLKAKRIERFAGA
jgi:hypothetical protein